MMPTWRKNREMSKLISVADNRPPFSVGDLPESCRKDLRKLALPRISDLAKGDGGVLVFPQDLNVYGDKMGDQHIIEYWDDKLQTGNIMGFVGINDTRLRIRSRFDRGEDDYFLHYMLQKVFSINLFDLKFSSESEDVFDFLIYLFPYFLKKAVRQGIFRNYQHFSYNDANVRGPIDVARHIRRNVPFGGNVAYSIREYSHDNAMTELVRHTIEHITHHHYGKGILGGDKDTVDAVERIRMATPQYQRRNQRTIISQNLRPLNHPYYTEYRPLQQLCLSILRREELKYGRKQDEIYGILFDGAWLWEEYLDTILSRCNFCHPHNKTGEGGIPVFKKDGLRFYPDFWRDDFVLDAKYKRYGETSVQSDDYHQIIAYMYLKQMKRGGLVVPFDKALDKKKKTKELEGYGGTIKVYGLNVEASGSSFDEYVARMAKEEQRLMEEVASASD